MAQIPNAKAATESDGQNDYFNVNTLNQRVELPNGATLQMYADAYITAGMQLLTGTVALLQSASAVVVTNGSIVATAGLGVARIAPAAIVPNIKLAAGTVSGQMCWLINEAAAANYITFHLTPATANVADSAQEPPVYGQTARLFVWDNVTGFWYSMGQLQQGTNAPLQSATAVAIANAGTIATTNIGISRLNPGAAVTGIIMANGTIQGQTCWVINEAAAANSITFNTTPATANVADSATEPAIAGLTARQFVWDNSTNLWYRAA